MAREDSPGPNAEGDDKVSRLRNYLNEGLERQPSETTSAREEAGVLRSSIHETAVDMDVANSPIVFHLPESPGELSPTSPVSPRQMAPKRLQRQITRTMAKYDMVQDDIEEPAPPVQPMERNLPMIPTELRKSFRESVTDRMINSTVGRISWFLFTLIFMCAAAVCLVEWRSPTYRLSGASLPLLVTSIICVIVTFCALPMAGRRVGVAASVDGNDFKPYLVCYRMGFIAAVPGLSLIAYGYGGSLAFGSAAGAPGAMLFSDLQPSTLQYFETSDGFVALNLTKGVVETLHKMEHGPEDARRTSRFRNAELRINQEPFSDVPEPTRPPGAIMMYRIAPIFSRWVPCATLYDISQQCLGQNPVAGWAFSKTDTLCSNLRMVACLELDIVLDPVYRCSSDSPQHGQGYTANITGFCGRVMPPPPAAVVDELGAILKHAGWPDEFLPNTSQVWVDVKADDCIAEPQACVEQWDYIGLAGVLFFAAALVCVIVPACLDFVVDRRIREARAFYSLKMRRTAL